MRSNRTSLASHINEHARSLQFATDPVGDSRPIHPDIDRPALPELWRENLRKREQKQPSKKKPEGKQHPPSDHQIDDFA